MTYFRIGENDTLSTEGLIAIVAVLVVLAIAVWALYFFIKNKDNSKPLHTAKVKILEKASQQGNIEWYVVEFENGERNSETFMHQLSLLPQVMKESWNIKELPFNPSVHYQKTNKAKSA